MESGTWKHAVFNRAMSDAMAEWARCRRLVEDLETAETHALGRGVVTTALRTKLALARAEKKVAELTLQATWDAELYVSSRASSLKASVL